MQYPEPQPHFILQFFRHIEPGTPVKKVHLFFFLALLCVYSFLISYTIPIQSSKVSFLVITVQFFLNFFYAFHCKIELETIKKHHYSIIVSFCLGALCLFGTPPGGWLFLLLNIPFFGGLFKDFSSSQKLWSLMLIGLNIIVLVLLYVYSAPSENAKVWLFSQKYWAWSLILLTVALLWAYQGFNHTRENVHHLSNLINFIFIAFLPFLFVLQKNEPVPLHNFFGYLLLIPTILIGVIILSLLYFFVANLKASNFLALLNISSMFYLFVHANVYSSILIRLVFLVITLLMFANLPLKMNTFLIDSFEEIETNEDFIENNDSHNSLNKIDQDMSQDQGIIFIFFNVNRFRRYSRS